MRNSSSDKSSTSWISSMLLKIQRVEPATKKVLPPRSSNGAVSSTSGVAPASFAPRAAHKAALPAPTTTTSALLMSFNFTFTPPLVSCTSSLLQLNARLMHNFFPASELLADKRRKCRSRWGRERIDANGRVAFTAFGCVDGRRQRAVQTGDGCGGSANRHHHAQPIGRLQRGKTLFARRRDIRQQRGPRFSGHSNRAKLAGLTSGNGAGRSETRSGT